MPKIEASLQGPSSLCLFEIGNYSLVPVPSTFDSYATSIANSDHSVLQISGGLDFTHFTATAISAGTAILKQQFINSCGSTYTSPISITVNPTPSVSITASASIVTVGTSVTFTPTPTNGETSPTYQWFVNGVSKGFSPTYTYIPTDKDKIYCEMPTNNGRVGKCISA